MAMKPVPQATAVSLRGMMGSPRIPPFGTIVLQRSMGALARASVRLPPRVVWAGLLVIAFLSIAVRLQADPLKIPEGVWLVDPSAAVQIFDCNGLLCGRVVWLRHANDATGQVQRDKHNPDPAGRTRLVCGMTVLWGLRPAGPGRWEAGWFYNPDDGLTYSVAAELSSSDLIVARIYRVLPYFGETKTLHRVPRLSSEGWC